MLHEAASKCATPLVRNMATVGGALAVIYLPSDIGVALLALNPDLTLAGKGARVVAMESLLAEGWYSGYDIISDISLRKPGPGTGASFLKFGRGEIDIALINVASVIKVSEARRIEDLRIAVGQTSSLPGLLSELADQVRGEEITTQLVTDLARSASASFPAKGDSKASAEYRRELVRVLVGRTVLTAAQRAGVNLED
jgi:CO/xanthine dehydrogenase FAD-binding subunit